MSDWLLKIRDYAWVGAGMCVAAFGLRCMVGAISVARAQAKPSVVESPARKDSAQPTAPVEQRKDKRQRVVAAAAAATDAPRSLRVMLNITAGPERAEVYANGLRLGLTPYLGDYTCKQGEALRFEIVPEQGPLQVRRATCRGAMVNVR